jgi:hypothetical protein
VLIISISDNHAKLTWNAKNIANKAVEVRERFPMPIPPYYGVGFEGGWLLGQLKVLLNLGKNSGGAIPLAITSHKVLLGRALIIWSRRV